MDKLKWRLLEIVEENRSLHVELKRSVVDDIVRNVDVPLTSAPVSVISMPSPDISMPTQLPLNHFNHQKWQTELVINTVLYTVSLKNDTDVAHYNLDQINQFKSHSAR